MTGGFQDRQAEGVHDRLHARCMVLSDGETTIALVICDSCLIPREIYDAAKQSASKKTGIPVNRILTAATHTHTAPTAAPLAQCHPDPDYIEHLTNQITRSIVVAHKNLRSAELGLQTADLPEEVSNRRWFVKESAMTANPFGGTEDRVRTNPPRGIDVLIEPAGPVDPEITFLSLRSQDHQPQALLANYGLHYVGGIPGGQLSADYFGEFARQITDHLDADESFVGMMSNGASGDVNNYRFLEPRERQPPFERIREVAAAVVQKYDSVDEKIVYQNDLTINMLERELTLGIRQPGANELTRARKLLKNAADPKRLTMNELYAQESVRLSEADPQVTIKLQTIALGDLAIVAIPCEVFADIGLEIKQKSPFKQTFVIALANGYHGYLPTPEQHALGGYETWCSGWSYLETEASVKISEQALKMLGEIRK
ncbi:MAG: neutral/alkaline non-lysosomal ceramidase N-terminal domain-containing protein [Planctomycetaceae bacterium]|nr:neutral/alkaline non-lysosomal ceramidase N-terminal domain-containing protein [Planctomycetaceae bacterium]